jgi:hypothetical protein
MIVPVDRFQFFELDSYSGINVSADKNKTYIKRSGVKLNLNTQGPAVENAEYEFRIQTIYGDTQAINAEFVFCDSGGSEIYSKTVNANGYNGGTDLGDGSFTLRLNPETEGFAAGTYGKITFIGANGVRYLHA